MEIKDLSIVITTFKSENKIYSCLDTLPKKIRIIVVENSNNEKSLYLLEIICNPNGKFVFFDL